MLPQIVNREALDGAEVVVSVMPSHLCRGLFHELHAYLTPGMLIVSATKGLENDSLMRMSEVIQQVVHSAKGFIPRVGALERAIVRQGSGARRSTAVTIASQDAQLAEIIQREFSDRDSAFIRMMMSSASSWAGH